MEMCFERPVSWRAVLVDLIGLLFPWFFAEGETEGPSSLLPPRRSPWEKLAEAGKKRDSFLSLDPQDGGSGKTPEGGTPKGTPGSGAGDGTPSTGDDGKGKRGGNKWSWGVRTVLLPLSVLGFIIFFILAVLPSQEITTIVDGEETEITLVDYVRSLHGRISELEQTVKPGGGGSVVVLSADDAKILSALIEGVRDDDKDGVPNSDDRCSGTEWKALLNGCSGDQIWEACTGGVSPLGTSFIRSGCGTTSGSLTCDWGTSSWINCHE